MSEIVPEGGGTPVPASVKAATQPQVNLIPPEVEQRRQRGRSRVLIMLALAGWIGVLGAVVFFTELSAQSAEDALDDERLETDRLNAEIASYAYVPAIQAELENANNARLYVGGFDVDLAEILLKLNQYLPESAAIESLAWEPAHVSGSIPETNGLFDGPVVGGFTFSGQLTEYYEATYIEDALNAIPGFERGRVDGLVRIEEAGVIFYTFGGSVYYDATLLTNRFGPEWEERRALDDAITDAQAEIEALLTLGGELFAELVATPAEDTDTIVEIQARVADAQEALDQAFADLEAAEAALDAYLEAKAAEEAAAEAEGEAEPEPEPSPSPSAGSEEGGE